MTDREIVENYYRDIDAQDLEKVYQLFDDRIIYNRAGKVMREISELKDFYEADRKLVGRHEIKRIVGDDGVIISEGSFIGINGRGEEIDIKFCDVFDIENGKIKERTTYINDSFEKIQ